MTLFDYITNTTGIFVLCFFLLVLVAWMVYIRTSRFHVLLNRIPGPTYLSFIESPMDFIRGVNVSFEDIQMKLRERYGDIYKIGVGLDSYVFITSPELMEPIFKSQTLLDKGASYKFLALWLGDGLGHSTGDKWRSRRKLLTPTFHFKILEKFLESFQDQSKILVQLISEKCRNTSSGQNSTQIDVFPLVTRCSLDIICETIFGTQFGAQTQDSEYVTTVEDTKNLLIERIMSPFLWNDTIYASTTSGRKFQKLIKILHQVTDDIINRRRESSKSISIRKNNISEKGHDENENKKRLALLDLLLEVSDDGKVLSKLDIREEIDTFMAAGFDTTASTMGWFLYCMASNQEHQEKVVDEIEHIFGDSNRNCTSEDINGLKYLQMCIKETLRLYPPLYVIQRFLKEDVKTGGYVIPAGATLAFLPFQAHRNPDHFPQPLVFDPTRFLPENSVGRHPYAYVPFSAGPRNCIGQKFAMMELTCVLSTLLRQFKFQVSPTAKKPVPTHNVTLKPLNGINLIVSLRDTAHHLNLN